MGDGVSERREEILALAADIFARKGFAATTVREIADAAGILSGSLYHHFDSKESMIDEVLAGFLHRMVDGYEEIVATAADPLDALERLVRFAFAGLVAHRSAVAIAQNESHYLQQLDRFAWIRQTNAHIDDLWTSVLDDGVAQGVLRPDLDVTLAHRLLRDAIWATTRWLHTMPNRSIDEIADEYYRVLIDGMRPRSTC